MSFLHLKILTRVGAGVGGEVHLYPPPSVYSSLLLTQNKCGRERKNNNIQLYSVGDNIIQLGYSIRKPFYLHIFK